MKYSVKMFKKRWKYREGNTDLTDPVTVKAPSESEAALTVCRKAGPGLYKVAVWSDKWTIHRFTVKI